MTDIGAGELASEESTQLHTWWEEGDWTASDLRGAMRLNLRHRHGDLRDGVYESSSGVGDETLQLKSPRGRAWVETSQVSEIWTDFGMWSGVNEYFPPLPESDAALEVSLPLRGGANDKTRALDLPTPRAEAMPTRIELFRWIEVAGQRAAVIRSRYAYSGGSELLGYSDPESGCGLSRTIKLEGEAQYVVLESGILLHAEIREEIVQGVGNVILGGAFTSPIRSEARLVAGCGQPELADFPELPGAGPMPEAQL
ncbi:hypothetical protein [Enhygromyxa salina]|nr:hypothetical protein [Enhygromyxa salina]